jgi:ubiquinone/menaquinone biosynthesis C-methylase UbiE
MIDQQHRGKFENVWDNGNYRQGSTAQRLLPRLLGWIPEDATIIDYGCGTGRMEVELHKIRPNQKVLMIDIASNAIEQEAKALINDSDNYDFIHADLADLSMLNFKASFGICINTLMTVQRDKLFTILDEIHRTCWKLIVEVYERPDERCGQDMTTCKFDNHTWRLILKDVWQKVEYFPSDGGRYIYLCED